MTPSKKALVKAESVLRDYLWPVEENIKQSFHDFLFFLLVERDQTFKKVAGLTNYSESYLRATARRSGWKITNRHQHKAEVFTLSTGERGTIEELCRLKDKKYGTVISRMSKGASLEAALEEETLAKKNPHIAAWHAIPKEKKKRRAWLLARRAYLKLKKAADAAWEKENGFETQQHWLRCA